MATSQNSFDASTLRGFVKSPLDARNGGSRCPWKRDYRLFAKGHNTNGVITVFNAAVGAVPPGFYSCGLSDGCWWDNVGAGHQPGEQASLSQDRLMCDPTYVWSTGGVPISTLKVDGVVWTATMKLRQTEYSFGLVAASSAGPLGPYTITSQTYSPFGRFTFTEFWVEAFGSEDRTF